MIDVAAMLSDQGDERSTSGEISDRGISFSEVRVFVACKH
jgi:hypothetical protein